MAIEQTDWSERIALLMAVKRELAEADLEALWEFRLPGPGATEEQLKAVEAHIGEGLDPAYRSFLLHADGWSAFFQTIDLFGSYDLMGLSDRFRHANTMLSWMTDDVLARCGLHRSELLLIGGSPEELDLHVMTRRSAKERGVVVWLAGSEIERYPNFEDYFLAMIDYNREEIREIQGDLD